MSRRKIIALIFIVLGTAYSIIYTNLNIDYLIELMGDGVKNIVLFTTIASIIFATLSIISILKNKKLILLGVMLILFCGVIPGVFYFIWRPDEVHLTTNESVSSLSWVCPNCNKVNYYTYTCSCGYEKAHDKKVCSSCGAENMDNAVYCSRCGQKL